MLFSPAGTPLNAEIHYRNGRSKIADIPKIEWDLYYEIQAFCDMIAKKIDCKKFNKYTIETIQLMDFIRKQQGIEFPADKF